MGDRRLIHIHVHAPPKPLQGEGCNGCGVCCLLEPCPLGVLLTQARHGACVAVQWDDTALHYRCSAVTAPRAVLDHDLPAWLHGVAPWGEKVLSVLAPRWISQGTGCDCDAQIDAQGVTDKDMRNAQSDG